MVSSSFFFFLNKMTTFEIKRQQRVVAALRMTPKARLTV